MLYWLLKYVVVGPWVRLLLRPKATGLEHLPRRGPVIVVPNHLAEVDSLVLGVVLPRRITFLAKSEYYEAGATRDRRTSALYALLCRATGQIAVDRSGGEPAAAALAAARTLLARGGAWVIYPEGTRSPDGRLHRGHTGAARVALACDGVPVVPVGIIGARDRDVPESRARCRRHVQIIVGKPLDLSRWRGRAEDPVAWREATDHLMTRIQALTDQEYVDRYASRRHAP